MSAIAAWWQPPPPPPELSAAWWQRMLGMAPPPPPPPPEFLSSGVIAAVVIGFLMFEYLLSSVASLLNVRSMSSVMPLEFDGLYDAEAYAKSQEYTRVKAVNSLVYRTYDVLVFATFWSVGGFEYVDEVVQSLAPARLVVQGLLYLGMIVVGSSVLELPFSVYYTFVLEERFGFNRTTLRTFVLDRLKGLALMLLIGPPVLGAILYFFIHFGDHAWFYVWLLLAAVQVTLQFIAPVLLMPLFLKFTPLADGELKGAIVAFADSVAFRYGGIFEVDGSTRSSHSNAFFTGFGATKRIALFDTLVQKFTLDEVVAVLAHEVGHEKHGHVLQSLFFGLGYTLVLLKLMGLFLSYGPLFAAFGVSRVSVHVGFALFQILFAPLDTLLQILLTMRSRSNEFQADRYSVTTYRKPEALVSALKKLSKDSLSNLTPHWLIVFLSYSHPPVLQRVLAIRACAAVNNVKLI